jgi:hypothetical protein
LTKLAKTSGRGLKPFPFIYDFFQKAKAHNMLTLMLDLHYKGLRLVIQYVGKEKTQQITSEYDHQILLSFLVYAYNYLHQSDVNAQAPNFIPQNNHKFI